MFVNQSIMNMTYIPQSNTPNMQLYNTPHAHQHQHQYQSSNYNYSNNIYSNANANAYKYPYYYQNNYAATASNYVQNMQDNNYYANQYHNKAPIHSQMANFGNQVANRNIYQNNKSGFNSPKSQLSLKFDKISNEMNNSTTNIQSPVLTSCSQSQLSSSYNNSYGVIGQLQFSKQMKRTNEMVNDEDASSKKFKLSHNNINTSQSAYIPDNRGYENMCQIKQESTHTINNYNHSRMPQSNYSTATHVSHETHIQHNIHSYTNHISRQYTSNTEQFVNSNHDGNNQTYPRASIIQREDVNSEYNRPCNIQNEYYDYSSKQANNQQQKQNNIQQHQQSLSLERTNSNHQAIASINLLNKATHANTDTTEAIYNYKEKSPFQAEPKSLNDEKSVEKTYSNVENIHGEVVSVMDSILSIFDSIESIDTNFENNLLNKIKSKTPNKNGIFPNYVISSVFQLTVGEE